MTTARPRGAWKKVESCLFAQGFAETEKHLFPYSLHQCAGKIYSIPRDLSANECHYYDVGFYDLQERLALEFYKAAVGVDERIKRQVVEGHKRGFEDPNEAFWCGGDALYTGAPATIPDRRRHEGHALPGILKLAVTVLCCLLILGHFDRRRRRRPRPAPQDDDDSDGDFEPGPRTTTASARRRSPRLAGRRRRLSPRGAVEWNFDAFRRVLEGIAALSAVVYTVGVGIGLPPY